MRNAKRLGISNHVYTRPLTEPLRGDGVFSLAEDIRPAIAKRLREQDLHAALLSPLDYAKDSSEYCIVPEIAAASTGNGSVVVRFRPGVKNITSLAVDPGFASEIILTKIILAEEFNLEPAILPMHGSVDVMLQKAEAALLTGDAAFAHWGGLDNIIDIVEEWNEMTGLPYVHALWCGRENDLTEEEIEHIQSAGLKGVSGMKDIALQFPKDQRRGVQEFLETFMYELTSEVRESLAEFMKYLYYHGFLPDVADLNFYKTESATNQLPSDVSPN